MRNNHKGNMLDVFLMGVFKQAQALSRMLRVKEVAFGLNMYFM